MSQANIDDVCQIISSKSTFWLLLLSSVRFASFSFSWILIVFRGVIRLGLWLHSLFFLLNPNIPVACLLMAPWWPRVCILLNSLFYRRLFLHHVHAYNRLSVDTWFLIGTLFILENGCFLGASMSWLSSFSSGNCGEFKPDKSKPSSSSLSQSLSSNGSFGLDLAILTVVN